MSAERKADIEAALVELEFEIALAIRQGAMPKDFRWTATFAGPPSAQGESSSPWIALLSVGEVG